jgi:hypothetical protein
MACLPKLNSSVQTGHTGHSILPPSCLQCFFSILIIGSLSIAAFEVGLR